MNNYRVTFSRHANFIQGQPQAVILVGIVVMDTSLGRAIEQARVVLPRETGITLSDYELTEAVHEP